MLNGLFMHEITPMDLLGQIFGTIALIISCARYFKKKKTDVMRYSIISYLCYIVHYFFIGALAGSYTLILAIARDYYIYLREKHHKKHRNRLLYNNALVFLILFSIYITLIILNISEPGNILPLGAGLVYLCFEWFTTNKTTLKIAGGITTVPWIIYNVLCFSIPGIITDSISVIVCIAGVMKDKKQRKKSRA